MREMRLTVFEDLEISLHPETDGYGVIYLNEGQSLMPGEYEFKLDNGQGGKITTDFFTNRLSDMDSLILFKELEHLH